MSSYYEDPHQNPYWQNLTGNHGGNNQQDDDLNRQNTRNTDPNWHPEPEYGRQLGRTAASFGIMAIVVGFFLPIFVPSIIGGVAIILAILSRGRETHMTRSARHGAIAGSIAVFANLALLITVLVTFHQMVTNPSVRQQANQIMEQMYGITFDDMLEQIEGEYGIDLENGDLSFPEEQNPSYDSNSSIPDNSYEDTPDYNGSPSDLPEYDSGVYA